jgi:hypothetical protein
MNIRKKDRNGFSDYTKPLRLLEKTFQSAGIPVVFQARDWPVHGKTVYITHPSFPKHKAISIEGDSVCQAVKDVAAFVLDAI